MLLTDKEVSQRGSEQVVLVTGAAGALGRVVVEALAQAGHKVWASGRKKKAEAPSSCQLPGVHYRSLELDKVADSEHLIKEIIEHEGKIDAAFLLAGGFTMGGIAETPASLVDHQVTLNFKTAYHLARLAFIEMSRRRFGNICFIGAEVALSPHTGGFAMAYTLSKSMLSAFVAVLAEEGKSVNVRSSLIVPSIIDTPANRAAMPDAQHEQWVPPSAVADALLLLLEERTTYWHSPIIRLTPRS